MSSAINFPSTFPELRGTSLRLRELCESDIPAWYERATDVESADLAGDPVPASIAVGNAWLQRQRDHFRQETGIRWAIVPAGLAVSVGTIALSIRSDEERTADLGVVIARAHWGRGVGTSAAELVVRYAFDTLGLARIRAEALKRNVASIRLLGKTGFRWVCDLPPSAAEPEEMVSHALANPGAEAR